MTVNQLPTPCYVVDEGKIEENCRILRGVMDRTGCRILLAQKAFSLYALYPLIGRYLSGTAASGLYETRLAHEHFPGESHVFSAAYRADEWDEMLNYADHMVFNSIAQLRELGPRAKAAGKSIGLRVNPQHSTQEGHALYDPCAPLSRLGVTLEQFDPDCLDLLDGLHFHTLCEQDALPLVETVEALEKRFGPWLHRLSWLNFGGGHHITKPGYDIDVLEACIRRVQGTYKVRVYLEPGEAVALDAGFLVTKVLDIVHNDMDIAILDTSAACHMPDVLEMSYRPPLAGSGRPGEKLYPYRLAGMTCLAGDVIGDYSFDTRLMVGDNLMFGDMAIYTMVKNNTFNGMPLPSIALMDQTGACRVIRTFGYDDFKGRLC